jgi:hypothetical protein
MITLFVRVGGQVCALALFLLLTALRRASQRCAHNSQRKKHTQQVFVSPTATVFRRLFFSPSFQRDFVCVKTLPLGEFF